jgi:hypothetical protein
MMRPAQRLGLAATIALLGLSSPARAEEPTALQLFEKGRKLMEQRATLDEACKTLEQSLELADRGDTLLNLAECHRRQGRSATAWAEFDRALKVGTTVGFAEAIRAATRFRDYLYARLSHLTVTVSPETAALPEFTLLLNGKPWPKEKWNVSLPYDPGSIEVSATAKGYKPFIANVGLGPEKGARTVVVVLEVVPPPPPPPPVVVAPPPPPPPVVVPRSRPVWPWIVGAAGLGLAGAAIGLEVDSRSAGSQLNAKCGAVRNLCPVGFDFASLRAREVRGFDLFLGLGAGGVVGIAAAAIGLGVWSRGAPEGPRTGVVLGPTSVTIQSSF